MIVIPIINAIMNSITYILTTDRVDYCDLIDCGYSEELIPTLKKIGKKINNVYLTHAHYDHIYGLNTLISNYPNVLVYTNEEARLALFDVKKNFSKYHPELEPFIFQYIDNVRILNEGEKEIFETERMQVLFTPGHDVTCFSYIIGNKLFTGDTYIPGIKTVVSFPRSNRKDAIISLERLKALENKGYEICPGHILPKTK